MDVPTLTRAQMVEVDRIMIEDLGITLIQMMEHAGRNLARLCLDRYEPSAVTVLAGSGGNGGGGMVAARHMASLGVDVVVVPSRPVDLLSGVVWRQAETLLAMGIPIAGDPPRPGDVIIDALVGYSLSGGLRGRPADLVDWANGSGIPTLALDTPSGMDVDDGSASGPVIGADATMTLALPKAGLIGSPFVGDLYLADIGVPASIYERFGLAVPTRLFRPAAIVRL